MVETINIQLSLTLSPFLSPIQVFIQRYWVDYNTWRYSFIVLSTLDFPIPFSHSDSSRVRWRREGQFQGHVTKCMGSILPGTFSWWRGMRGAFTYKLYWFCVCVCVCVCVLMGGCLTWEIHTCLNDILAFVPTDLYSMTGMGSKKRGAERGEPVPGAWGAETVKDLGKGLWDPQGSRGYSSQMLLQQHQSKSFRKVGFWKKLAEELGN